LYWCLFHNIALSHWYKMSTEHFCHWPKYYYNLLGGPTIQGKRRNSWRSFPRFLGVDPDCTDGLPWFLLIPEQDMFRLVSLLKRHIWHMTTKPKNRSEAKKKENREIKRHVYDKRQTSDSSWEFLRIENKQIKTVQNNSYG